MKTNAGPWVDRRDLCNGANGRAARTLSALGLSLSGLGLCLALGGCFGYVEGPGGDLVVEPDMFMFGGYSQGGPARDYGRRGAESRGVVARFGRGGRAERKR